MRCSNWWPRSLAYDSEARTAEDDKASLLDKYGTSDMRRCLSENASELSGHGEINLLVVEKGEERMLRRFANPEVEEKDGPVGE